jgi:hypothetical protein
MMITNILATVLISVLTNWVDVYEQVPAWDNFVPCQEVYITNSYVDTSCQLYWPIQEMKNGAYLGKDGTVVEVTEISFDYLNEPQVHRIEKPIKTITMRGHEAPPAKPDFIWDAPVIEPIADITATYWTNIATNISCIAHTNDFYSMTNYPVDTESPEFKQAVQDEIERLKGQQVN